MHSRLSLISGPWAIDFLPLTSERGILISTPYSCGEENEIVYKSLSIAPANHEGSVNTGPCSSEETGFVGFGLESFLPWSMHI